MTTVVARHKVGNFSTWKAGHQDRLDVFAPAVASYQAFQDMDDPNSVVLVLEVADMELLGSIMNDPNNQGLKDKHTVLEPITMSMKIDY